MYLVAIAWIYVALMMAVAEATHANGSVLGGVVTFLLYGLGPVALVMYLLGTPHRRAARRAAEAAAAQAQAAGPAAAAGAAEAEAAPVSAPQDPRATTPPPPSGP